MPTYTTDNIDKASIFCRHKESHKEKTDLARSQECTLLQCRVKSLS